MSKDQIMGLIRHLLTTGAGVLVSHGYVGNSDVEQVVGAVMILVGVVWSFISKNKVSQDKNSKISSGLKGLIIFLSVLGLLLSPVSAYAQTVESTFYANNTAILTISIYPAYSSCIYFNNGLMYIHWLHSCVVLRSHIHVVGQSTYSPIFGSYIDIDSVTVLN